VISSSTDKKIRVWKLDNDQLFPLTSWTGHSNIPNKFLMDVNKNKLYTYDNVNYSKQRPTIRSWNVDTLERDIVFPVDRNVNYNDIDIAFVNNDTVIYGTEVIGRLTLWDADKATVIMTQDLNYSVSSVLSFSSNYFFLQTDIGVLLWDNRNLSGPVYNFQGHNDSMVLGMHKIDENNLLSYSNGKIILWNINRDILGQIDINYHVTGVESKNHLWIKNPNYIDCFSLNGEHLGTVIDNSGPILSLSPFKNYLLTSSNRFLNVWNTHGQEITTFQGHQNNINTICSHQDWIFTGSSDGCIRQWQMV